MFLLRRCVVFVWIVLGVHGKNNWYSKTVSEMLDNKQERWRTFS